MNMTKDVISKAIKKYEEYSNGFNLIYSVVKIEEGQLLFRIKSADCDVASTEYIIYLDNENKTILVRSRIGKSEALFRFVDYGDKVNAIFNAMLWIISNYLQQPPLLYQLSRRHYQEGKN